MHLRMIVDPNKIQLNQALYEIEHFLILPRNNLSLSPALLYKHSW